MFLMAMSLSQMKKEIESNIKNPKIIEQFTFSHFKYQLELIANKMNSQELYDLIKHINENLSDDDFQILSSHSFSFYENHHDEINPSIENPLKYFTKLCEGYRFCVFLIEKLSLYFINHQHIVYFIEIQSYGILKRIEELIKYYYNLWFSLVLIFIIAKELSKNSFIANKDKVFWLIFSEYLNITGIFNLHFLDYHLILQYYKYQDITHIKEKQNRITEKKAQILNSITEIINGVIHERSNNFLKIMFEHPSEFDSHIKFLLKLMYILYNLSFSQYEVENLCNFLENLEHIYGNDSNVFESNHGFFYFINGFFKYIALSPFTNILFFPEIIGFLQNNLIYQQVFLSHHSLVVTNKDFFFLKNKTLDSSNIFALFNNINHNKIEFIIENFINDIFRNTYYKIFKIYEKLLSRPVGFDLSDL